MNRREERTSPSGRDPEEQERDDLVADPASARPSLAVRPGTISGLPWGEYVAREYAAPHRIALYDMGGGTPYCGLIAPAPSGYLWRQQASGMLCAQRELEGIYLPIPDSELAQNLESLHVGCCMDTRDDWEVAEAYRAAHPEEVAATDAWTREHMPELAAIQGAFATADRPRGIDAEEADQLDKLLRVARLPLSVARDQLERSTEAWIWVRVAGDVTAWEHEYAYTPTPEGDPHATMTPAGYRFQWMLAALAGTEAVLTWQNCD